MEVEVNLSALIDSPHEIGSKSLFTVNENQVDDFSSDIIHGPPTSYLVSGYRGVGKTSLIRRVEQTITSRTLSDDESEVVFVYTGFAGYSNSSHLVRKLVRELYLKIDTSIRFQNLKNDSDNLKENLKLLHQRTFNEVHESSDKSVEIEKEFIFDLPIGKIAGEIFKSVSPLVVLLLLSTPIFDSIDVSWLMDWVLPFTMVAWSVLNVATMKYSFSRRSSVLNKLYTKTLYDEEIAETLFLDILKKTKKNNFKVVFVLDELDKLEGDSLDKLIRELKVYLVSGFASFIVVGGQDFYYRFREESDLDDSILSSLFSKMYHVSLSSIPVLQDFFFRNVITKAEIIRLSGSDSERDKLNILVDYFIFHSRLVPRRFISLIRQNLTWREGKAFLSTNHKHLPNYKNWIDSIDKIDDKVASEHSGPVRDFIVMQMYIALVKQGIFRA